ncbi:hypothetical protein MHK_001953 [Candidatus Magnetomorum sp. HK-1]|nr:hypothetical protein MHK_001953 [Candidatus Magnetomorum sp. HK-1]
MSDFKIGIVVEGTTDRIIIESALNYIFKDHAYTMIQLQPEQSFNHVYYPCPPASDTTKNLERVVYNWLNLSGQVFKPLVMCIPSKCIEAWLATAYYGENDSNILIDIECNAGIENYLSQKPAKERFIRNRKRKKKRVV